jgi:hypothetical protein
LFQWPEWHLNCNLKGVDSQRARTFTIQASTVGVELVLELEEPTREVAHVGSEGILEAVEKAPILGYRGCRNMVKEEARERVEGLDGEVNAAIVGKQSVHHASDDLQEIGKICNQCRQIFP